MSEYRPAAQVCADQIHAKITVGIYPAGEWLPLIEQLCEELGTDTATVKAALALLTANEVVTHERYMGHYPAGKKPDHGPARPKRKGIEAVPTQPQTSADFLDNEFVTVAELAAYLRISVMTASRHAKKMEGTIRIGKVLRIPSDSVRTFLKEAGYKLG